MMFVYQNEREICLTQLVGVELCAYQLAAIPFAMGISLVDALNASGAGRRPAGLSLSADK